MKVEFFRHSLNSSDKKEISRVIDSIFLTTGKWVSDFEKQFAKFLGVPYVVGVTSCTDALFLSLKSIGIEEGDEVITTPLTFISTANAIEYCGAKPVLIDVEKETGNIDANLIEEAITKKTKAIIVVHMYGQLCDMKRISSIAKKHKLKIIEDAAHSVEGKRDGVGSGQLGDLGCFSFYATKNITSGEGGAISCHSKKTYEWLKKARLHGMSKGAADRYTRKYKHWDMEFLGYKANMSNLQASMLKNQLKRIEQQLTRREELAERYYQGFMKNPNISTPEVLPKTKHARYVFTIWVEPEKRDQILRSIQDKGIGVAVNFRSIHLLSYYKSKYGYRVGDFPEAERIGFSTISLPFYPKLSIREINYVISCVNHITK